MRSYLLHKPQPFFIQQILNQPGLGGMQSPRLSRVASKVKRWLAARPPEESNHPILAQNIAREIRETDTAVGRALAELGYIRRRGGRKSDSIRFHNRRIWTLGM